MSVTVAVCTLDRPRLLRGALESLAETDVPGDLAWEVLVVDNGGAPGTAAAVEALEGRLPLRRVREPELGLSHARNRSLRECRTRWIAWIDDDVRVDRGWLAAYARAFERRPDAAFFGGPIRPVFEGRPPGWLEEAFGALPAVRAAYGERRPGGEPREIGDRELLPYGGNFAVRAAVLPDDPFDPRLGRRGDGLEGGEELDVLGRLLDRGHAGRWVPEAGLEHVVPARRQTVDHLRRYFRAQGRVQDPLPEDRPVPRLFGKPRWALRTRIEEGAKYLLLRPIASPGRWVRHLIEASFAAGALDAPPEEPDGRTS